MLDVLQEYGKQGGVATGWPAYAEEKLKGRGQSLKGRVQSLAFQISPHLRSLKRQRVTQLPLRRDWLFHPP